MKEYIEYFTGLQRSYGVCKVDDGYIDEVTGKKKWKHEWTIYSFICHPVYFVEATPVSLCRLCTHWPCLLPKGKLYNIF